MLKKKKFFFNSYKIKGNSLQEEKKNHMKYLRRHIYIG